MKIVSKQIKGNKPYMQTKIKTQSCGFRWRSNQSWTISQYVTGLVHQAISTVSLTNDHFHPRWTTLTTMYLC